MLVDGIKDLSLLNELSALVDVPLAFNQIAGGKSPAVTLTELADRGVSIAIYSTPALFAAQSAIEAAMVDLEAADGRLVQPNEGGIGVAGCNTLLTENLERASSVRSDREQQRRPLPPHRDLRGHHARAAAMEPGDRHHGDIADTRSKERDGVQRPGFDEQPVTPCSNRTVASPPGRC